MATIEEAFAVMTKEERKFVFVLAEVLKRCPESMRAVAVVDSRDSRDLFGRITGCCEGCADELLMEAAELITDEIDLDLVLPEGAVIH